MIKLGVFFGGRSGEHQVSLSSGPAVMRAVDKEKYQVVPIGITKEGKWLLYDGPLERIENDTWEELGKAFDISKLKEYIDFAFPVLHGTYGEDGTIQGLFEMLDLPYAGCGVLSSALNMDKGFTKDLFEKYGLPTCKYQLITADQMAKDMDKVIKETIEKLGLPLFVKPANAGSSVGVSKAKDEEGLKNALKEALKYDRRIVVEEFVQCREIETAVIGNDEPIVGAVGEIVVASDFYDYKAKYTDDAGTRLDIPANIDEETKALIQKLAIKTYKILDCAGFARVDFFIDKKTGKVLLNEINTIPGFTRYSMFPMLMKEAGIGFGELVDKIVGFGYERYNAKNSR